MREKKRKFESEDALKQSTPQKGKKAKRLKETSSEKETTERKTEEVSKAPPKTTDVATGVRQSKVGKTARVAQVKEKKRMKS